MGTCISGCCALWDSRGTRTGDHSRRRSRRAVTGLEFVRERENRSGKCKSNEGIHLDEGGITINYVSWWVPDKRPRRQAKGAKERWFACWRIVLNTVTGGEASRHCLEPTSYYSYGAEMTVTWATTGGGGVLVLIACLLG